MVQIGTGTALRYLAESDNVPWEVLPLYLKSRREKDVEEAKHYNERMEYEIERDNYMLDQLWALGAGRTFVEEKGSGKSKTTKPTYPRWGDILKAKMQKKQSKKSKKVKNITHADRMAMFRGEGRLWA